MKKNSSFSEKLKQFAPISREEFPKFFFSALILMLIIYVYSILRASKDSLVVSSMGAELLSAIKLYGVLPSAILFMLVYTKLADLFSRSKLFHIINWFFISFFCAFSLLLYPNEQSIHFDMSRFVEAAPYLKYLFIMIGGWSFSLFYILSELWGSVMLSLLFWQLANQITSVDQAKRFYPLFGLVGQIGLLMSGFLGKLFSSESNASEGWGQTLNYITLSVLLCGIAISYSLRRVASIAGYEAINGAKKSSGKKKIKMGFLSSLKYIVSSKSILLITMLILCYGTSINLVEGVWKKSLQLLCTDSKSYSAYMADVQIWTSVFTALAMTCGVFLLKRMSWKCAAMLTPLTIAGTGAAFFILTIFDNNIEPTVVALGLSAIQVAAFLGATQNVLSKAVKYAFFDATKEMAYIPLDPDLKSKGKAAADVVGGRLGKSSGAVIQQLALSAIPGSTLISISPILFGIFIVIMGIWFVSVALLSKEFEASSAKPQKADAS